MKFSIRDLLLITLVVALGLGWLVDHWRAAARDAAWEKAIQKPLNQLSLHVREIMTFETPGGMYRVTPLEDVPMGEPR